jgi:hypothetical protein
MSDFFQEALDGGTKKTLSVLLRSWRTEYDLVFWITKQDTPPDDRMSGNLIGMLLTAVSNSKTATWANVFDVYNNPPKDWAKIALVVFPDDMGIEVDELAGIVLDEFVANGAQAFEFPDTYDYEHLIRRFAALGI